MARRRCFALRTFFLAGTALFLSLSAGLLFMFQVELPAPSGRALLQGDSFPLSSQGPSAGDRSFCPSVFLIWTTSPSSLRQINYKCLESVFFHHPCAKVTVYASKLRNSHFSRLRDAGMDIEVLLIEDSLFQGIPRGKRWLSRQEELSTHPNYPAHFSDFLRYAILYQHGGTYLDFDHLLTKSLPRVPNAVGAEYCMPDNPDCFRKEAVPSLQTLGEPWLPDARICAAQGVLLNWQAWHPILFEGLKHFDDDYDAECWGCAGPRLFGRLIPKYADRVTLLAPRMLYPVNYREVSKTFETHDQMLLDRIDNESVGFHLYGKVIGQLPMHPHSTVVDLFARNQLFEDDLTRKVFRYGEFQSPIRRTFTDRFIHELYPLYDPARWSLSPGCRRGDGRTGAPEGGFRPDLPNIAACLLSYKRIQQHPQVLKSIASHPAMVRIVVMNVDEWSASVVTQVANAERQFHLMQRTSLIGISMVLCSVASHLVCNLILNSFHDEVGVASADGTVLCTGGGCFENTWKTFIAFPALADVLAVALLVEKHRRGSAKHGILKPLLGSPHVSGAISEVDAVAVPAIG